MPVLVEDSAEAPASSYVEVGDVVRVGDRRGQRVQRFYNTHRTLPAG